MFVPVIIDRVCILYLLLTVYFYYLYPFELCTQYHCLLVSDIKLKNIRKKQCMVTYSRVDHHPKSQRNHFKDRHSNKKVMHNFGSTSDKTLSPFAKQVIVHCTTSVH